MAKNNSTVLNVMAFVDEFSPESSLVDTLVFVEEAAEDILAYGPRVMCESILLSGDTGDPDEYEFHMLEKAFLLVPLMNVSRRMRRSDAPTFEQFTSAQAMMDDDDVRGFLREIESGSAFDGLPLEAVTAYRFMASVIARDFQRMVDQVNNTMMAQAKTGVNPEALQADRLMSYHVESSCRKILKDMKELSRG